MAKTFEISRRTKGAKAFYSTVKREMAKKGFNLEDWCEDFEAFINPISESEYRSKEETCVIKPYQWHLYNINNYNFILEYDAYDDNEGFGYCYLLDNNE